ncbi:hypothetical protein PSPO01_03422 [Paraphaeosphaeria sporulosa]
MGRQAVKFRARERGSHLLFLLFSRAAQMACDDVPSSPSARSGRGNWNSAGRVHCSGRSQSCQRTPAKYRRRGFAHRSVSDRLQANTQCNAGEQRGSKQRRWQHDKRRQARQENRSASPCVPAELLLVWAEPQVA